MAATGGKGQADGRPVYGAGAMKDANAKGPKGKPGATNKLLAKSRGNKHGKADTRSNDSESKDTCPEAIKSALLSPELRIFLLRWERELVAFVKSAVEGKASSLVISNVRLTNLYHRLLVHQLCQYTHLSHINTPHKDIEVSLMEGFDYSALISSGGSLGDLTPLAETIQETLPKTSPKANVHAPKKPLLKRREAPPSSSATSDILLEMSSLAISLEPQDPETLIQVARASKEEQYKKAREAIFEALDAEDDGVDDDSSESDDDNNIDNAGLNGLGPEHFQQEYGYIPHPPLQPLYFPAGYPLDVYNQGYPQGYPQPFSMYAPPVAYPPNMGMVPGPVPYGIYYDAESQRRHLNDPYSAVPNAEPVQTSPWPPRLM